MSVYLFGIWIYFEDLSANLEIIKFDNHKHLYKLTIPTISGYWFKKLHLENNTVKKFTQTTGLNMAYLKHTPKLYQNTLKQVFSQPKERYTYETLWSVYVLHTNGYATFLYFYISPFI